MEEPALDGPDDDADARDDTGKDAMLDVSDLTPGLEDASWRFGKSTEVTVAVTPALVEVTLLDAAKVGTGTVDELPAAEAGGISAGHRLHSPRDASQYVSTMNLRSPTASKLEKHFWNDASSYCPLVKQAARSDTRGTVWKLIGTWSPTSRWVCRGC